MKCQARQYSDQMHCAACGLTWDTNDLDPPKCNNGVAVPLSHNGHRYTQTFRPAYIRARDEIAAMLAPQPAAQMTNETLIETALQCHYLSVTYGTKVQFDRVAECRAELMRRLTANQNNEVSP